MAQAGHDINAKATEGIDPADLAAFMATLSRLVDNLQALSRPNPAHTTDRRRAPL